MKGTPEIIFTIVGIFLACGIFGYSLSEIGFIVNQLKSE